MYHHRLNLQRYRKLASIGHSEHVFHDWSSEERVAGEEPLEYSLSVRNKLLFRWLRLRSICPLLWPLWARSDYYREISDVNDSITSESRRSERWTLKYWPIPSQLWLLRTDFGEGGTKSQVSFFFSLYGRPQCDRAELRSSQNTFFDSAPKIVRFQDQLVRLLGVASSVPPWRKSLFVFILVGFLLNVADVLNRIRIFEESLPEKKLVLTLVSLWFF